MMGVPKQRQGIVISLIMHILVLLWCFHVTAEVRAFQFPKSAPKHSLMQLSATSKGPRQTKKRRRKDEMESILAGKSHADNGEMKVLHVLILSYSR